MAGQYNLVVEYNKPLLQTHQDENLCQYWNIILSVVWIAEWLITSSLFKIINPSIQSQLRSLIFISVCWGLLFLLQLHFLDLCLFLSPLSNPPYFPFYWPLLPQQLLLILLWCLFFVALPTLILYVISKAIYYKILFINTI